MPDLTNAEWERLAREKANFDPETAEAEQDNKRLVVFVGIFAVILITVAGIAMCGTTERKDPNDLSQYSEAQLKNAVKTKHGGYIVTDADGTNRHISAYAVQRRRGGPAGSGEPRKTAYHNYTQTWLKKEVPVQCTWAEMFPKMKESCWTWLWIAVAIALFWYWVQCPSCWDPQFGITGYGGTCLCSYESFEIVFIATLCLLPFIGALVCGACYHKVCTRTKLVTHGNAPVYHDPNRPEQLQGYLRQMEHEIALERKAEKEANNPKKAKAPETPKSDE